jgi:hypothetical protein
VTDEEFMQLLRLIKKYSDQEGAIDNETTVSDLVDDVAMGMNPTPNEADEIRRELGN